MKFSKFTTTCAIALLAATFATAENLVILHTNDTHSNIRPERLDKPGGMVRAKVAIDSIRKAEEHVLLLDAGDDVQGHMYFPLFGGRVEYEMMNRMGYEMTTIGNHEFDNGLDSLANCYRLLECPVVNANYDFSKANAFLDGRVKPYQIKSYRGHRIAVIGIGADPRSLVVDKNYQGMTYREPMALADSIAGALKEQGKADYAIVLSHIGYKPAQPGLPSDSIMALSSSNIDLIIGGHSHTSIDPAKGNRQYIFTNKIGKQVLVAQNANECPTIGKITIDLDNLGSLPKYELLPIDSRYDGRLDAATEKWLKYYDDEVTRIMTQIIGTSETDIERNSNAMHNWVADVIGILGEQVGGAKVDGAVTNSGGIRASLSKGDVSVGQIMNLVPFTNAITVMEMDGATLLRCLDDLAATGGQCVNSQISFTISGKKAVDAHINGKKIDKKKTYRIATIDYVAEGNDHLESFRDGRVVAHSDRFVKYDMIDYVKALTASGQTINADTTERIHRK